MKSYNQFVTEAYSAREDLNEVVGVAAKLLGKLGSKGFRAGKTFAKYAGRKGLGAGMAGYALACHLDVSIHPGFLMHACCISYLERHILAATSCPKMLRPKCYTHGAGMSRFWCSKKAVHHL